MQEGDYSEEKIAVFLLIMDLTSVVYYDKMGCGCVLQ